jgi:hypothetical protein
MLTGIYRPEQIAGPIFVGMPPIIVGNVYQILGIFVLLVYHWSGGIKNYSTFPWW